MKFTVKADMTPVNVVMKRLGLDPDGDAQRQLTADVNRRITRYMPYRSSALSTKLKHIASSTEIEVMGPYAKYQYNGMAMEGKAPRRVTDRPLDYTQSRAHNPQAGPYWDRRLMAAEGEQIAADLAKYITRRRGR